MECVTTHTDQIFDAAAPTVVLTILKGFVRVTVPQIYVSNGLIEGELRIDVYTTEGPLDLILDNYPMAAFSANWKDISLGKKK